MFDLLEQLNEQKRKVDFDTFDISVKEIVSMTSDKLIDIAPEYQRRFRWDERRQSVFIESVFLGIPVPSLYTAANQDGTWELIDGVQRLSTLIHFIGEQNLRDRICLKDSLRLTALQKLSEFNKLTFEELPQSVRLQFLLKPLKVTTVSDKSDHIVRFDLFERLNTGGISLTPQEIRACIYRGDFNEFLRQMARDSNFRHLVRLSREAEHDGTREEFVLKFFAYLHEYRQFDHLVTEFLNSYMERASKGFDYAENGKLFATVCRTLAPLFPSGIVRGGSRTRTPANLYEAVCVGAALALNTKGKIAKKNVTKWIDSEELRRVTGEGSNTRQNVARRIEFCRDQFLGQ
ncbi:MAG: DUF262 domain-containing protein [Bryobacterales bacterium]|nr:DUF262 domain-containing protein [Bryobacterales bacterium]